MPSLRHRSYEPEIMDDFSISDQGLLQTLRELDFINKWLGGNQITLSAFEQVAKHLSGQQDLCIADLGCGSGEMLRLIYQRWHRQFPNMRCIGYDANPAVVEYARQHTPDHWPFSYVCADVLSQPLAGQPDVVLCTLFLHHFSETEIRGLLQNLADSQSTYLIVNDLQRHIVAYQAIRLLTALFSRSYMTRYDACLSVARGFHKAELQSLFATGPWKTRHLQWKWAFRWAAILNREA